MREKLLLLGFLLSFGAVRGTTQQNRPSEIPSHYEAALGKDWLSAKTVSVAVTSRHSENPDSLQDLERMKKKILAILPKMPLAQSTGESPDLTLEMVVEANVRYGMFHYQNAPYIYLLLRDSSDSHLV